MRRLVLVAGMVALAGCGSNNQDAVGANSPGSVTTTAMGNVVGSIPTDTPTPVASDNAMNAADSLSDTMTNDTNATTTTVITNAM